MQTRTCRTPSPRLRLDVPLLKAVKALLALVFPAETTKVVPCGSCAAAVTPRGLGWWYCDSLSSRRGLATL